ncbi:GB-1, partial [Symbiodinium microadriaticum]
MSELQERINAAKKQLEGLRNDIENTKKSKTDRTLYETLSLRSNTSQPLPLLRTRRVLRGHFGKVYASCWSGDSTHLVSASQDGKLMVWNGFTTNKVQSIPLASSWVITCAYEQSVNRLVACGGMDNTCSLYKVDMTASNRVIRVSQELSGHLGYLSSCTFLGEGQILTASGDSTCNLWDIEKGRPVSIFRDHSADVMSVSVSNHDPHMFVSGSCDALALVWDIRSGQSVMTFRGHSSDINAVAFFPDGRAVGTGSDDHSCRIFDMRCVNELAVLGGDKIISGITSVSFSRSGRVLFAGYEDFAVRGWDLAAPSPSMACALTLTGHENRVSSVGVNLEGNALLTGSWDTLLR